MHTPTLLTFLYILIITSRMCIAYNMIVILIVAVNLALDRLIHQQGFVLR
jgi:hypothetical protein